MPNLKNKEEEKMRDLKELGDQLAEDEGFRSKPYKCTEGVWTFGHGFTWITEEESLVLLRGGTLKGRAYELEQRVSDAFDWYDEMPPKIKDVVLNMCFNLGIRGFSKFKKAIQNMKDRKWEASADEMLDSLWARQVGNRAKRLANIVREHG
tara:strand:- start:16 stop:468 length:453 start_codon:yes stop_codon:yes gene_type:complete